MPAISTARARSSSWARTRQLDADTRPADSQGGAASGRPVVASPRPSALDGGATEVVRYAPGDAGALLADLAAALGAGSASRAPGEHAEDAKRLASALRDTENVVVVWGEELAGGDDGPAQQLLAVADALGLADRDGSGLLEVPRQSNARGCARSAVRPTPDSGYGEAPRRGRRVEIARLLDSDELAAAILVNADPIRDSRDGGRWRDALDHADFVVAYSMFRDESTSRADVVFPAESYAEKEGDSDPSGRPPAAAAPGDPASGPSQDGLEVLVELSAALGGARAHTGPMVLDEILREVPFYAGVTHEEIGGTGVRWQARRRGEHPEAGQRPAGVSAGGVRAGRRTAAARHLPRPVGGRGHGAKPGAALPRAAPDARAAPADAERLAVKNGQPVEALERAQPPGVTRSGSGCDPGPPSDRGNGREQPQPPAGADEVEVRALTPEEEGAR